MLWRLYQSVNSKHFTLLEALKHFSFILLEMTIFNRTYLLIILSLLQRLHSLENGRSPRVVVRTATEYSDYIHIMLHKHRALLTGNSIQPEHHHQSITNMMADSKQISFMAYIGNTIAGCADLITTTAGSQYYVQNVVVSRECRRCGVASALLDSVEEYVNGEQARFSLENRHLPPEAILELDVDRSNLSAKSLYTKRGFLPRFCWGNLLNHRQKMYRTLKVHQVASENNPSAYGAKLNLESLTFNYGI